MSIELPPYWGWASDVHKALGRTFGDGIDFGVESTQTMPKVLESLAEIERQIHRDLEERLNYLLRAYEEAGPLVHKALENTDDQETKDLLSSISALIEERLSSDSNRRHRWRFPGYVQDIGHGDPYEYPARLSHLASSDVWSHALHAVQIINIIAKNPLATAFISASATQIVNSIAAWAKERRADKPAEIRLYGADGALIDKRKLK